MSDGTAHQEEFDGKFGWWWAWFFGGWPRRLSASMSGEPRERLLDSLELRGNETVVDAGSGSGFYSLALAQRLPLGCVIAVDTSISMIRRLEQSARGNFAKRIHAAVGNAQELPMASGVADASIAVAALHHLSEPSRSLREHLRVLRPAGRLAVLDWLSKDDGQQRHHHNHLPLTKQQMVDTLRGIGFEQVSVEQHRTWALCLARKPAVQGPPRVTPSNLTA